MQPPPVGSGPGQQGYPPEGLGFPPSSDPGHMQQLVDLLGSKVPPKSTAVVECPKTMVGRVIGKGGETIKALQQYTGAMIQIDQSSDPTRVTIAGLPQALQLAVSMVNDIVRGTFKGFAMLRQIALANASSPGMATYGQQHAPVYVQGYGFVPPSQAYGGGEDPLAGMFRTSPAGPITPPISPMRGAGEGSFSPNLAAMLLGGSQVGGQPGFPGMGPGAMSQGNMSPQHQHHHQDNGEKVMHLAGREGPSGFVVDWCPQGSHQQHQARTPDAISVLYHLVFIDPFNGPLASFQSPAASTDAMLSQLLTQLSFNQQAAEAAASMQQHSPHAYLSQHGTPPGTPGSGGGGGVLDAAGLQTLLAQAALLGRTNMAGGGGPGYAGPHDLPTEASAAQLARAGAGGLGVGGGPGVAGSGSGDGGAGSMRSSRDGSAGGLSALLAGLGHGLGPAQAAPGPGTGSPASSSPLTGEPGFGGGAEGGGRWPTGAGGVEEAGSSMCWGATRSPARPPACL